MALLPNDVKLDSNLTKTLGDVGQGPQNDLNSVYSRIRSRFGADSRGPGLHSSAPGGYFDTRANVAQGQSNAGLRGSLESVLGNTGYNDFKSEREFQQNMNLARLTGEMNRPSTLDEVLGSLGGLAQSGGEGYAAYRNRRRAPAYSPNGATQSMDFGYEPDYQNA